MIDPNSTKTLIAVGNEVCRLLEQYGLIETEPNEYGPGRVMEDDMYAIYEDFTCSILSELQKLNTDPLDEWANPTV